MVTYFSNVIYIWPLENARNYSDNDTNLYVCMHIDVYQMFNLMKTYIHSIVLRRLKHCNVIYFSNHTQK